ncbi:hypothetical protein AQUSIP_09120 [Aquicella siphonis]|uniref:DUF302 domain-containing protein n=1 Tax=Aquicella siphonis TaxID=254247 RepID=A0A5E4PGL9_9COXI|nr:DUF302 domain-containing protein [Aquicella siphonis]VVC75622.1 hypothetical protein AQUSIP_09120 [Aquicella siphonis]
MYGLHVTLYDSFDNAVASTINALKAEGFGVLTEIDVKATLKQKLNIDKPPYLILGACNPVLAHQALEIDPDIGLLLPCNVVIREENDKSITVSILDPDALMSLTDKPEIRQIARSARERLERVQASLQKSS